MMEIPFRYLSRNNFKSSFSLPRSLAVGVVAACSLIGCAPNELLASPTIDLSSSEAEPNQDDHIDERSLDDQLRFALLELDQARTASLVYPRSLGVPTELNDIIALDNLLTPLCMDESPQGFFDLLAEYYGLDGSVNIDDLVSRFDAEIIDVDANEEMEGAALLEGVRVDKFLGNQMSASAGSRGSQNWAGSAEFAVVWRARCQTAQFNTRLLQQLVTQVGFPSASHVGSDLAAAAMVAFKHSDPRDPYLDEYMELAEEARAMGDLRAQEMALLIDGLAMMRQEPLPFGTYVTCDGGNAVVGAPLADPDGVEALRAEYGLGLLSEQLAQLQQMCSMMPPTP